MLSLYNSLTRQVEPFEPAEPPVVRMYVCGVTPYDVGHLGHALCYVSFDTLRRYLEFNSYEVRHIQNITDIDDDMVRKSSELGLTIAELTDQNHAIYLRELDALHVQRPERYPRVSGTMTEIVDMVQRLIAQGHAYAVDGHVFFDTSTAPRFGVLSGHTREELRNAPRTDTMPNEPEHLKRDPLDFLLWQPSTYPGATFDSPWGAGRPGWHIECSAMAAANLGPQLDIHGGGRDLLYPHHESEIAQSEAASGAVPFVRTWMHIGTMQLDGVKMSKSLGNLVKVSELLAQGHSPDAIRISLLATHYRAVHDFDADALRHWGARVARLRQAAEAPGGPPDRLAVARHRNAFMTAMDNDLDTPQAIAVLEAMADELLGGRLHGATGAPALVEMAGVLGLTLGRAD